MAEAHGRIVWPLFMFSYSASDKLAYTGIPSPSPPSEIPPIDTPPPIVRVGRNPSLGLSQPGIDATRLALVACLLRALFVLAVVTSSTIGSASEPSQPQDRLVLVGQATASPL
jgi:hypothetical protein